jgi:hypothetical protein
MVSVKAGPLLTGGNPLGEIRQEIKLLLSDVATIQKALAEIQSNPLNQAHIDVLLSLLSQFLGKLSHLEGRINELKELGKIKVADTMFLEIKLSTCNKTIDTLISDLSQTPPDIEHAKPSKMGSCRKALNSINNKSCLRKCFRIPRQLPILSESLERFTPNAPPLASRTAYQYYYQFLQQYLTRAIS